MHKKYPNVIKVNTNFIEDINRINTITGVNVINTEADEFGQGCSVSIELDHIDGNTFRFYGDINKGKAISYKWTIKNKLNQVVFESHQTGFIDFDKPQPDLPPYTIEVFVKIEDNFKQICYASANLSFSFPDEPYPCEHLDMQFNRADVDVREALKYNFGFYLLNGGSHPPNYNLIWDFGDGTIINGNLYTHNKISHTYQVPDGEILKRIICVTIIDPATNCSNTVCKTIHVGCGLPMSNMLYNVYYTKNDLLQPWFRLRYPIGKHYDTFTASFYNYHKYGGWGWWKKKVACAGIEFRLNVVRDCINMYDHQFKGRCPLSQVSDKESNGQRYNQLRKKTYAVYNIWHETGSPGSYYHYGPFFVYWLN